MKKNLTAIIFILMITTAFGQTTREAKLSVFDAKYYITANPDLQIMSTKVFTRNGDSPLEIAGINTATNHWLSKGINEGRPSRADFNIRAYLERYPDLVKAFGPNNWAAALDHWLTYGKKEGRNPGPPKGKAGLTIVSGNGQTKSRSSVESSIYMANFDPFVVKLVDLDNNPLAGETVAWSINAPQNMAVQAGNDNGTAESKNWNQIVTDNQGLARLQGGWPGRGARAYYSDGNFTITATCKGQVVTFNETVGGALVVTGKISIVSGDNQVVSRAAISPQNGNVSGGVAIFAPISVMVTNNNGAPAANLKLFFQGKSDNNYMAVDMQAQSTAITNAGGIATLNGLRVYYADGPFKITVSGDGLAPVVLNFTVPPQKMND